MGSRGGVRNFFCSQFFCCRRFQFLGLVLPRSCSPWDASEAPRKILHAQLRIPAKPGTLTLYYPKRIPGEHGPTGPITDLMGLKLRRAERR